MGDGAHRAVGGGSQLASLLPGGLPNNSGVPADALHDFPERPVSGVQRAGTPREGEAPAHPDESEDEETDPQGRSSRHKEAPGTATGGGATYKGQFSNMDGGRDPRAHGGKLGTKEARCPAQE